MFVRGVAVWFDNCIATFMKKIRIIVLGICVIGAVVSLCALLSRERTTMRVYVLDVGQGDSILVESPNGCDVVIDTGPRSGATIVPLQSTLPLFDRTLDVVAITHAHADHAGGLTEVSRRFDVAAVLGAFASSTVSIAEGDRISCGDGVYLEILRYDARAEDSKNPHRGALIARVVYGMTSMLLASDSDTAVESELISHYGTSLKSDVLKVAHHGSRTATSEEFLRAVHPRYAVISVGKGNTFGHPHKETLERLKNASVETIRTDEVGSVLFESDGSEITYRKK